MFRDRLGLRVPVDVVELLISTPRIPECPAVCVRGMCVCVCVGGGGGGGGKGGDKDGDCIT